MLLAVEVMLLHAEVMLLQFQRFGGKSGATPYPYLGEGMALPCHAMFCLYHFLSQKVKYIPPMVATAAIVITIMIVFISVFAVYP